MPSPFPGMNPYLERGDVWTDFHTSFVVGLRDALVRVAPPDLRVHVAEHVYIHERYEHECPSAHAPEYRYGPTVPAVDRTPAPATITLGQIAGEFRQPYLEVRRRGASEPVCVIDVLSPFLKYPGPDRDQHWHRVRCSLVRTAGYVEIDLLRGGLRMPWPDRPACDYAVTISGYSERPYALAWSLRVQDRLPAVRVPLRYDLPELPVDLQEVFDRVYDAAGYDRHVHDGTPEPTLSAEDAAWARDLIAAAGGRA